MYFLNLEDKTGSISVTLFPRAAALLTDVPQKDSVIIVKGKTSHRDRINKGGGEGDEGGSAASVEISADQIAPVASAETLLGNGANVVREARPAFSCLNIRLEETMNKKALEALQRKLAEHRAPSGSRLLLHVCDGPRTRRVQPNLTVAPDEGMVNYLRHLLGSPQAVWTE